MEEMFKQEIEKFTLLLEMLNATNATIMDTRQETVT